ncbi:MAG: hypothetical protein DRG20_05895 [Deltaproteobacteria bacterium]|nr:tetratricopeptide repeat protein [Deltaproteobacteria bacterium]RLA88601.1 MAG: hypothetical protein DRG20_05895 [Deltaproteobacteria bacterium]
MANKNKLDKKEKLLEIANKLVLKRQFKKAIEYYKEIINIDPNDIRLKVKLGDLLLRLNKIKEAIEQYFQAADFYVKDDYYLKAISLYKKILNIEPKNVEAHHKLAELYIKQGFTGDARIQYQRLLKIAPNDKKALAALNSLDSSDVETLPTEEIMLYPDEEEDEIPFPKSEEIEEIGDLFNELERQIDEQVAEDDAETRYNLGIGYREMGLWEKAIKQFKIAKKDKNFEFDSMVMIGSCYQDLGIPRKAIKHFKEALKKEGIEREKLLNLYYQLALAYEKAGKIKDALEAFKKVRDLQIGFRDTEEKIAKLSSNLIS